MDIGMLNQSQTGNEWSGWPSWEQEEWHERQWHNPQHEWHENSIDAFNKGKGKGTGKGKANKANQQAKEQRPESATTAAKRDT